MSGVGRFLREALTILRDIRDGRRGGHVTASMLEDDELVMCGACGTAIATDEEPRVVRTNEGIELEVRTCEQCARLSPHLLASHAMDHVNEALKGRTDG